VAVDGRPYGDPGFLRRLEEYHRAAAEAHKGHGRVLLELPEAREPVPSDHVADWPWRPLTDGSEPGR
jgi:hypothetical protein